jgi:hypothetical protein
MTARALASSGRARARAEHGAAAGTGYERPCARAIQPNFRSQTSNTPWISRASCRRYRASEQRGVVVQRKPRGDAARFQAPSIELGYYKRRQTRFRDAQWALFPSDAGSKT